jgi:hypothetical protein
VAGFALAICSAIPISRQENRAKRCRASNPEIHQPPKLMKAMDHSREPAHLGYLLDELRRGGVTTYAGLAAALNRQGLRPARGRWKAHELYLVMRRHRRAHPAARLNAGGALYSRRAAEARRLIGRLKRRGLKKASLIAGALNARGSTTPRHGRLWTARSVARVWQESGRRRRLPRR